MVFGNTRRVGDPEKLARSLYRLRSTITHEGRMADDDATLSTEQALLGVAEGVMLDSLDGKATGNITD
ncbi:hypothetical protein BJI69_13750 [Luteibacter rhizovicinus DSM 16549]|uniref:Uncharacterized protein n=1 Tax=Luteibacter rhizovicinus DSM 16549 TaxID=1440763 RepID=A0A0G9HFN9_9GAMM|nr:hypothetical protein BJI69_13750 [Luteibacter rhizovicinus DSM 16549]KLD68538.1 hypothetical protein Y883_02430 [Luteibacter rhizovicinus DSM 16549]KLD74368.1 hypothetical protein Y886_33015 [Xanthomonas hyacinthi DSM 19077]